MNAYEYLKQGAIVPVTMDAIRDLVELGKQQADRIGVLEANHEIQKNINDKALQYIDQLEQGLRASIDLNNAQATRTTPQTKPLSDEEIDDVAKSNFEGVGRLIYMIAGNVKGDDFRQAVRSLARAIEERHGIK